jgi:hypothetical protein
MTEAEWLTAIEPFPMLVHLRGNPRHRKLGCGHLGARRPSKSASPSGVSMTDPADISYPPLRQLGNGEGR